MIIFMCKKDCFCDTIVITNRKLVEGEYLAQLERVTELKPCGLILREKDLSDEEYEGLARNVKDICDDNGVVFFVHSRFEIAKKINCGGIHISVSDLSEIEKHKKDFEKISVSCHSMEDVIMALNCGATQVFLGTIFETECKKGLIGRGIEFVREISEYCRKNGDIPVYAIGGITPENISLVKEAGARGGCMMSYMMKLK